MDPIRYHVAHDFRPRVIRPQVVQPGLRLDAGDVRELLELLGFKYGVDEHGDLYVEAGPPCWELQPPGATK